MKHMRQPLHATDQRTSPGEPLAPAIDDDRAVSNPAPIARQR